MIEINTLYVARTTTRGSAKFARLSDYQRINGGVWAVRGVEGGGQRYFDAGYMFITLCETTEFSRRVWSASLPPYWTDNVNTDRFWVNKTHVQEDQRLAWKFVPDEKSGVLLIKFCDFRGNTQLLYSDIPLIPPKPFHH